MVKVFVKAICVFGRHCSIADKYLDGDERQGLGEFYVQKSYESIESFLGREAKQIIVPQIKPLPYINEGIITGPNASSIYSYNECLITNCFVSGNGFNFNGVYHTIISAGFSEKDIQETFLRLKQASPWQCLRHWTENPNFKREIYVSP